MKYRIEISDEAEADILREFCYIREDSVQNAARWVLGINAAIERLRSFPNRCGLARETSFYPSQTLRQLIYASHRVIFEVIDDGKTVHNYHVRHAKMRAIGERESDEE